MPRIIVTSRYLKSNAKTGAGGLIKYIATRESVENYTPNAAVSIDFNKDLEVLLRKFPDSKNLFEYADYKADPSPHNAKELISEIVERNADKLYSREKIISYMAERPGVVKDGKHGLFSDTDNNIVLSKVMDEVANLKGNIWTHVVSLKREDAERLGYNTPEMWRQLIKRNIATIASESKIDMTNLRWYAAFHNTAHHPHIHLVVYSKKPKQGYLSKDGIEKIRSKLANDIFQNELTEIYQKQTNVRDLIKETAQKEGQSLFLWYNGIVTTSFFGESEICHL